MRIHRLIGIILLIQSRGIVKAKELARALETSERTIYRDIDVLCEAGLPIRSMHGPSGGFSFMEEYKINVNNLRCNDVINLLLCGMGVRPEEYTENAVALKNAIVKLENSVPDEYKPDIKKAKERFYFDSNPWWREVSVNKNLDVIRKAVWQLNKLNIRYVKYNGEKSERIIRPYGLIVKESEWYLVAYCEKRNEERIFKCDRIDEVETINEIFKIPADFCLETFWMENVKIFKEQAINRSRKKYRNYSVKIRVKNEKKDLLQGFEILDHFQGEGYHYYILDMINFYTACTVLFPLGDRVEIIEPIEIRDYIVRKANSIIKLNK